MLRDASAIPLPEDQTPPVMFEMHRRELQSNRFASPTLSPSHSLT
jgi:hypothetical protein